MRATPWLKLVFSLVVLAYVLVVSRPERIAGALVRADWRLVAAAAAVWGVIQLLNVYKWWLLIRAQGLAVSFSRLGDLYFVGMFFNAFLPSGFGGDAARAYELTADSGKAGSSLASVGVDRFISLYALLLVATGALLVAPPAWRLVPVWAAVGMDLAGAAAFALMLDGRWLRRLAAWRVLARRPRWAGVLVEIAESTAALRSLGAVAAALGIAVLYQFLAVAMHGLIIAALGIAVPFSFVAVFLPILTLAICLPVSINGLGIREGGYIYYLAPFGATAGQAVSVSLLSLGMLLLSAAWGAFRYARLRALPPAASQGSQAG